MEEEYLKEPNFFSGSKSLDCWKLKKILGSWVLESGETWLGTEENGRCC